MLKSVGKQLQNQVVQFIQPENKIDRDYLEFSVVETAAIGLEVLFGEAGYYGTMTTYAAVKFVKWQQCSTDENNQNMANLQPQVKEQLKSKKMDNDGQ